MVNLKLEILQHHSKANATKVAKKIGTNRSQFSKVLEMMLGNNLREQQMAAEVYYYCILRNPEWIEDHLDLVLGKIEFEKVHNGLRRVFYRALCTVSVPTILQGRVYNLCMHTLQDHNSPVGIRSYTMTILYHITQEEPGLSNELMLVIKEAMRCGKPAITGKGAKIIAELR